MTRTAALAREFFWEHPEWWTAGIAGLAWMVMLAAAWEHSGHTFHSKAGFGQELFHWMCMSVAMMLPFILASVQSTAFSSLWRRRHRAMSGFLIGFSGLWLVVGMGASTLRQWDVGHTPIAAAGAFAAGAVWMQTPIYRRWVHYCHARVPLAPTGWRADWDCLRSGWQVGTGCLVVCWPVMFGCAFAGHGILALAGGVLVSGMERWYFRPKRRTASAICLALAACYLLPVSFFR
jgi:hypothetical protein